MDFRRASFHTSIVVFMLGLGTLPVYAEDELQDPKSHFSQSGSGGSTYCSKNGKNCPMFGRIHNYDYDCICPGFKREVCSYGPSGSIITYPNLCVGKCSITKDRSREMGILPRYICKSGLQPLDGASNWNWTSEAWIREVRKEAKIWKKVNRLMVELVEYSNGGAPPCVCPAIVRPACAVSPSGNIINYDNICVMKCRAFQENTNVIRIGPNNCNKTIDSSAPVVSQDEEVELKEWFAFMEDEVKFYRSVSQAMSGLFVA